MYSDNWPMIDLLATVVIGSISPPPMQSYFKPELLKLVFCRLLKKIHRRGARDWHMADSLWHINRTKEPYAISHTL